jgi:hypothetical protein
MNDKKRAERKARIARREAQWIRQYEANMAQVLGDPGYKLPGGKEQRG